MWTEHVLNPKIVKAIFKDEAPSFERIEMHEVKLMLGGDLNCLIDFELPSFPQSPPLKWIQSGFNTVRFELLLIKTKFNSISIDGGVRTGNLVIVYSEPQFLIEFKTINYEVIFEATAAWIDISRISAYIKEKSI